MALVFPRVLAVGDRAVTVELGSSLDEETVGRVRALDARLRETGVAGILETVPTYASLMVLYDRRALPFPELSARLLELANDLPSTSPAGRLVDIPSLYDGEDLQEVADATGLSKEEVIDRHSCREYAVLMLGFSPGFAYMGFVDERLRLPRRKTPRTRVPEGSIAIAGAQTGIYPRTLPGGWNLLGRTSLRLFDAMQSSPSRLMPGDRVRFSPATALEPMPPPAETVYAGSGARILEPGLLTMVQDGGRPGLRRIAVPFTGFADPVAARTANSCVGRPWDAPVLEIYGPGLRVVFDRATFIAMSGARVVATLERGDLDGGRMSVPMNVAVRVRPGNLLSVTGVEEGVRSCLAIAGMAAPEVLGSASVDRGSGFLRPLATGDSLSVGPFDADRVRREPLSTEAPSAPVRVVLGPQLHHFGEDAIETFLGSGFRVGLDSDRVGARLDGPRLSHAGASEIVSDGMVPGCIQVPPDGRPIVMLNDCPTTGGYPKIGCVVSDDLGLVARAIPGKTPLRFAAVGIGDL